ncbi:MAG: hypothetical protein ABSE95_02270 [Thermodesulfobacteriota bacterium]|jgi:dolichyl-phosphate-mannose--protein O-mannosyl transferase
MFSNLTIAQPKLNLMLLYFLIGMTFIVTNYFGIFYWPLSYDDSVFMGAIRMVLEGKQIYRDFLWDPPIFLYINAFMAYLFGLDLIQLRILSFLFGLSAFLLLGFIMYRLRGHAGSILALCIAVTTFENIFYVSGIYMVSVATFFCF